MVFPACAVTRAQSRMMSDIDLTDTFISAPGLVFSSTAQPPQSPAAGSLPTAGGGEGALSLSVSKAQLSGHNRKIRLWLSVVLWLFVRKSVAYFWEDGVLMRKWTPPVADDLIWNSVFQVVVPLKFRSQVLTLGHDNVFAGHLGVTKTYNRILRYFFWPGLKADVAKLCRSCHVCQLAGKPNQTIPPAPLYPVPVLTEPFEKIILDCVGPLPHTKSGNKYLLTLMCSATRFPEAVPLRSLKTEAVVKALTQFFSLFGLPKVVQTDQGSNFLSRLFKQVLSHLGITHAVSSAYHPQSQGALERFHQTLKTMLRAYCWDTAKEWDEGLPLLLFAVREMVQESLGFSPAYLVFGHTLLGPLRLLRETWVSEQPAPSTNVLDYISAFRERLHKACSAALASLSSTQRDMKTHYDKRTVSRSFEPGDQVLVLLPIVGSALQAKFVGPYVVDSKLSETDYVIRTTNRKRKTRVCHINMLKSYVDRENVVVQNKAEKQGKPVISAALVSVPVTYSPAEDGLYLRNVPVASPRLQNSEILQDLEAYLSHLPVAECRQVTRLIQSHAALFSDVPVGTSVIQHDVDVGGHSPIRQHPYRLNPTKRAVMMSEVNYLLENELAVQSCSAWSSPCLLVPKPDGTFRFCTDYRKVNAVPKPDSFPLPRMEDCVDKVGAARVVTKLDLLRGYWQVPLTPRAAEISAFVTPDYFLQYSVMPFGLRNAPATFQRLICKVLAGVPCCEAYLDDIIIYSATWTQDLETLESVFKRLQQASLTLNLAKCEFGKATVTYLGKEVGQGQVRPVEAKVQAVMNFPVPTSKQELRRFLGMAGFYWGFCKNFSDVVCSH
ncbi:uncharacterized protein LOC114790140 isoform X1 [Denticeps clupeoides]|uniref:Gypsy retrotransposon integrase-like protein 1 n=1 Tax=Denticeps clupeoides TaxID=299321 RepID=A0AAY4AGI1_9TELE|nr:uncharacterized protein LOC114790140 isoform X1 [Denticeps clupeoides]XP_028835765.1 uncharacterized protein LOC114790140 isoform X1 [Denticeps clupeoides]